jgi:hypothetical protein
MELAIHVILRLDQEDCILGRGLTSYSKDQNTMVSDLGVQQTRGRRLIVLCSVQASLYTRETGTYT